MRQRTLSVFCSAVIAVLLLSGGGADLSAKTGRSKAKADRGDYSYAPAYESRGERGYRDIIPERGGDRFYESGNDCGSRAGSVSGGSVVVKYPDQKSSQKRCKTSVYTVKKGDTVYAISRKTGASVDSILEMNRISGGRINAGMKLKIETCGSSKPDRADTKYRKDDSASTTVSSGGFSWPLRKVNNYRRDGSEDIKSIGIFITGVPNSDVVASMEGVVKKIGYMRGYGRYVAISHEGRYVTVYSNLSGIFVKEGSRVSKGRVIGCLSSDRTLHFQIGHAGKPENPLKYLPARG